MLILELWERSATEYCDAGLLAVIVDAASYTVRRVATTYCWRAPRDPYF